MRAKVKFFLRLAAYYLFSALLFCGCIAKKNACNFCTDYKSTKDSSVIIKETILKDTTIYVNQKGETIFLNLPCDTIFKFKPIVISKNGIKQKIELINKAIAFTCDVDSLKLVIRGLRETQTTKTTVSTKIIKEPCINKRNRFDGFCFWWFIITCSILVLYIIFKVLKTYFKIF